MLASPVARVYAEALFGIAREKSTVDDVAQELEEFRALIDGQPEIAEFLNTPVIEPAVKVAQLKKALAGRATDLVSDFLCLLVQKRRFAAFGMVTEAFRAMADDHAGRMRVSVRSATALSDSLRQELADALGKRLDRTIEIEAETDPELMGGAVVAVGDKVWDGSLKSRLTRFRKQLVRS
ncbi:MAG: ATP synthase subunit delta [Gemmatimonadota bacterium]|nr:MAG: ATP synthase subunit delta [Gemmatimonadota bacterium]